MGQNVSDNVSADNVEEDTYLCEVENTCLQNVCDNMPADNVDKAVTRAIGGGATRRKEHACRWASPSAYRRVLHERHEGKSTRV